MPQSKPQPNKPGSSSKFGVHPKRWICQHCTFANDAHTRICLICDRTSDKPKYVEDESSGNITDDDKWNSGDDGSVLSPRNIAVNFQQDAEQVCVVRRY